jgi:hypothetical protein
MSFEASSIKAFGFLGNGTVIDKSGNALYLGNSTILSNGCNLFKGF